MSADKETIKKSFSEAAETYDKYAGVQRDIARGVVNYIKALLGSDTEGSNGKEVRLTNFLEQKLPGVHGLTILDIGCGTGAILNSLKESYPDSTLYGCDIALPMLEKARQGLGRGAVLTAADCEALPYANSSFDIVASSLTYQWVKDLTGAFREVQRVLAPGGLFVFSTLGPETFSELRQCFTEASNKPARSVVEFVDSDGLSEFIDMAGLELVGIQDFKVYKNYSSLRELVKTLKGIGATPTSKEDSLEGLSSGTVFKKAETLYGERFPSPEGGGIVATYDVIYVAAKKV